MGQCGFLFATSLRSCSRIWEREIGESSPLVCCAHLAKSAMMNDPQKGLLGPLGFCFAVILGGPLG